MPAFWRTASLARTIVAAAAVSIASAAFAQSSVPNFMMTWDASNDAVGAPGCGLQTGVQPFHGPHGCQRPASTCWGE